MRASSATSSSGVTANSAASSSIWRSKSSRCAFMETYSPAAIDEAPASRPARPARRTKAALALAPGEATTRLGGGAPPGRGGGGARVRGGVVGRAADLGAVEQRVDRSRPAEAGEKLQQPRLGAEGGRRQGPGLGAA